MRFSYNAEKEILRFYNEKRGDCELIENELKIKCPLLFSATYDPLNKYIRLVPVQEYVKRNKLIKISVSYTCKNEEEKDIAETGSNGLLYHISEKLCNNHIKIDQKQVTSFSRRDNRNDESGEIIISGIIEEFPSEQDDVDNVKQEINLTIDIDRFDSKSKFKGNIDVHYESPYKVFISCREDARDIFSDDIKCICKKYGLEINSIGTLNQSLTEEVVKKVEDSDALIIIFSLSDDEKEEYKEKSRSKNYRPNLGWLFFEYGISRSRKIPIIRLIDCNSVNRQDWDPWIKIEKDAFSFEFDISKQKTFRDVFDRAAHQICKKLTNQIF